MSAPNSWTPGNTYNGDLYQIAKNAQNLQKPAASGFSWNAPASAPVSVPALSYSHAPAPVSAPIQGGWSINFAGPQGVDPWSWNGPGPAPALAPAPIYPKPFNFGYGSLNNVEHKPSSSY